MVVAGANVHDTKLLRQTVENIVVARPDGPGKSLENLCPDKGYDNPAGRAAAADGGYWAHVRRIREEKLDASGVKRYPALRWVVERTLAGQSWFAMTKRHTTTWVRFNWRPPSSRTAVSTDCCFEIVS